RTVGCCHLLLLKCYLPFSFDIFILFLFYFFFQAEDGIRDRNVPGVQTCALPIFPTSVYTFSKNFSCPQGRSGMSGIYNLLTSPEIGRASCREREYNWVGVVIVKETSNHNTRNNAESAQDEHDYENERVGSD